MRWVQVNETSATRRDARRPRYSLEEVEQLVEKAARPTSVDVEVLPPGVERLDIERARRERQEKLEKSMREQANRVAIHNADTTALFVGRGGRETGRLGETSISKRRRASMISLVEQPTVNPYAVTKTDASGHGRILPNRRR